ncbi:polyprotein [Boraceia virus]|uniref:Envelopment polyprotein n=1 Tax=Boraceia virus TaxID=611708 RepID=A0A7D9MVQ7_9VIRU|nr:polyprotein [Boraceia virus]QLA46987.1 polyprotein [Boraceia virus]
MIKIVIFVICWVVATNSIAIDRCFTGGKVVKTFEANHSLPYICVKDDISYIKTSTKSLTSPSNAKTTFQNMILRKYLIHDWRKCRPEKMIGGPIMILTVNENGFISTEDFVCKNECNIKVNKEEGTIVLETKDFNYYQITGTTVSTGWFRSITTISLKHTCEDIQVSCGEKSILFHACFKNHIECYHYLNKGILPRNMVSSICHNIEIILLITFILIIFGIFTLIAKTYISYLLLPVFAPAAFVYGKLYQRCCKVCSECGLPIHVFTKCPLTCMCGNTFESTSRLKIHRTSNLCPGFKYMMLTRKMCKSKGCGFILSVFLAFLAFSFMQPVGAMSEMDFDPDCIPLEKFPEIYKNSTRMLQVLVRDNRYYAFAQYGIFLLAMFMVLLVTSYPHIILRPLIFKCSECLMFHPRIGLKKDEFGTNHCGSCTCGCPDESPMRDYHQMSIVCVSRYYIKFLKLLTVLVLVSALPNLFITYTLAEKPCNSDATATTCWGPGLEDEVHRTYEANKDLNKTIEEFFPDVIITEIVALENMPQKFKDFMKAEINHTSLRAIQMMEAYRYGNPEHSYIKYITDEDEYVSWSTELKLRQFSVCTKQLHSYPCDCIIEDKSCEMFNKYNRRQTSLANIQEDEKKHDLYRLLKLATKLIHPTTMAVYNAIVKSGNSTRFSEFANNVYRLYQPLAKINNFLYILLNITESLGLSKVQVPEIVEHLTTHPLLRDLKAKPDFLTAGVNNTIDALECIEPRRWACSSPRVGITSIQGLLTCKFQNIYLLFKWSDHIVGTSNRLCMYDKLCIQPFIKGSDLDLTMIKQITMCRQIDLNLDNFYNQDIKKCHMHSKGTCDINGKLKQLVSCNDGSVAEQIYTRHYDPSDQIDEICFLDNCLPTSKIHPINLKNCSLNVPRVSYQTSSFRDVDSIESYRSHLENEFMNSLVQYKFKPVSGLPHMVPNFISIDMKGVETNAGVESAYIIFDIVALGGKSNGIHIINKEGVNIMDIIISIRSANVSSGYRPIYKTGPTITFNSVHDEHCTGRCPEAVPYNREHWMPFQKEDTSNWGCEEYGCLAIGEGCLFGACKDVIKNDAEVWEKITKERISVELCVTLTHKSFCQEIISETPSINDKIEAELKTVESFELPDRVLIRNGKVYSGQINNRLEFNAYCGNVQNINGTTIGHGTPQFDYHCHAATRKDVVIRKCYDNNYDSCLTLENKKGIVIDSIIDSTMKLSLHDRILGNIQMKLHLGDLNYKQYKAVTNLDIAIDCVGCLNCLDGISCHLKIKTEYYASCEVESQCDTYLNRVIISPANKDYYMKLHCNRLEKDQIQIKICSTTVNVSPKIVSSKPVLELGTPGRTPYVKEHDDRCGTWMCKVSEEGLSFIFSPVGGFFSRIWHIIVIIALSLLALLIFIYILLPMIFKLRDILAKQAAQHEIETKIK